MFWKKDDSIIDESTTAGKYLAYTYRKVIFLVSILILLFVMSIFTIRLGATGLSYGDILHYLFNPDSSWNSTVIWNLRLPGIVGAILVGAALGIAGAVMQSILRNPLASPFTLGISNAAAFGASVGILLMGGGIVIGSVNAVIDVNDPFIVTLFAFIFAMVAMGVVIALVKLTECTPETIVLAGLAISSIFSAGLAFLQFIADDVALSAIVYWQFGNLGKIGWDNLTTIAIVMVPTILYFLYKRWDYNAIEAGEDVASGLGVRVERTRMVGLTMAALLTATVVSFVGIIGFIGLIGPHIVKRIIGNDNRFVLIGSMLIGAAVLLLAYIVGTYGFSTTIPVGIITSAIGGPLFIFILLKKWRKRR